MSPTLSNSCLTVAKIILTYKIILASAPMVIECPGAQHLCHTVTVCTAGPSPLVRSNIVHTVTFSLALFLIPHEPLAQAGSSVPQRPQTGVCCARSCSIFIFYNFFFLYWMIKKEEMIL